MAKKKEIDPLPDEPVAEETKTEGISPQEAALKAELAAANQKLQKFGVGLEIEAEVRSRMDLGLDREQAITCARRQALHNKALDAKHPNDTSLQEAMIQAASVG